MKSWCQVIASSIRLKKSYSSWSDRQALSLSLNFSFWQWRVRRCSEKVIVIWIVIPLQYAWFFNWIYHCRLKIVDCESHTKVTAYLYLMKWTNKSSSNVKMWKYLHFARISFNSGKLSYCNIPETQFKSSLLSTGLMLIFLSHLPNHPCLLWKPNWCFRIYFFLWLRIFSPIHISTT